VLRCCQAHDGVIAEASCGEGRVALSRAVVRVKRDWSNDQITEDVFGIYMQIAPRAQNGRAGSWNCGSLVSARLRTSTKTTEEWITNKIV